MEDNNRYVSQNEQALIFESTIGKILSTCCSEDKNETLERNYTYKVGNGNRMFQFDFHLENGCDNLKIGPKTLIEVKFVLYRRAFNIIKESYYNSLYVNDFNLTIIYFNSDFDVSTISSNDSQQITVKSFSEFLYPITEGKFNCNQAFNEAIKQAESTIESKYKEQSQTPEVEEVEENARKVFSLGNNTLFIGAGISKSAQLPDWNELLESLLKPDNGKPFHHINDANAVAISNCLANSAIVTGRYVIDGYSTTPDSETEQEVEKRIKRVLYNDGGKVASSKLVNTVAQVIKSNKVKQVITYNYDDLIEYKLNNTNRFIPICDISVQRNTKALPIYHVHGMISRNKEVGKAILSEKDYHELYSSMHHWANVVQLNALYTTTCFFIGFSMSDPNQRRILDLAYKGEDRFGDDKKAPHYVFWRKEKLEGEASEDVNREHWIQIQKMMKKFGLNVIWFEEFDDLPKLLAYIMGLKKAVKPNLIKVIK